MESTGLKRKAGVANAIGSEGYERYWKKRRQTILEGYDLNLGESRESTTLYGLKFVDMLRKTQDKSGRLVALEFEDLPPPESDFYRSIHMPISIALIEHKLHQRAFQDLSELEGYVKRMVLNFKEYYNRGSQVYDDAERIRKALSNYMVKTNPAYKRLAGYTAVATPLDAEPQPGTPEYDLSAYDPAEGDSEVYSELTLQNPYAHAAHAAAMAEQQQQQQQQDAAVAAAQAAQAAEEEAARDAAHRASRSDHEAEEGQQQTPGTATRSLRNRAPPPPPPAAAKKRGRRSAAAEEEEEEPAAEDDEGKGEDVGEEDAEGEEDDEAGGDDDEDDDEGYKGLTFQQAQEKLVEKLLNLQEDDEDWAHFEPFINLPPRSLKDYYQIIADPFSIKKLQNLVKGVHGRNSATGVSDFKNWAALEDKARLLWENAFFYNEEDSDIYVLAQELKKFCQEEVARAKEAVPDPSGPKIKLKVGQGEVAPAGTKKITIHVGGGRGGSADSPALLTGQSSDLMAQEGGAPNGSVAAAATIASRMSTSVPSPSPSVPTAAVALKREDSARQSPAALTPLPTAMAAVSGAPQQNVAAAALVNGRPTAGLPMPNGFYPAPPPPVVVSPYDMKYRLPGRGLEDALIPNLRIQTHPSLLGSLPRFTFDLPAHPTEATQSVTISLPAAHWKMQIIPTVTPLLEKNQRQWRMFVMTNRATLPRAVPVPYQNPPLTTADYLFESQLSMGVNLVEVQIVAAIERSKRTPGGPEVEVEKISLLLNLLKN